MANLNLYQVRYSMVNLTADIISRYSDVDSISDEVACNVGDENDNYIAKIFEKNYGSAVSFYEVFEKYSDEIFSTVVENNNLTEEDASKYLNFLNSCDTIIEDDENENVVNGLRIMMNDLVTLVGVKEAFEIAATFNPDNL
jgi:hypothetical protein